VGEVVLDVGRGSAVGPAGYDLDVPRLERVKSTEIYPAHRENVGESPNQPAKICLARAVRPVRETKQGLRSPLLLERHAPTSGSVLARLFAPAFATAIRETTVHGNMAAVV